MTVLIPSYEPDHRLVELIKSLRAMTEVPIIVVDDGSGEQFRSIFDSVKAAGCTVLTHIVNRGKGRALKTGFQYILDHSPAAAVVCADSDGQHSPKDIVAVGRASELTEADMVLGSRLFTGKVPLRSRFGNRLTSKVYNAATGVYEDMIKAGIIDPTKVTRVALQNAASVAGLMITTECAITELPEKEKTPPTPGGYGGEY